MKSRIYVFLILFCLSASSVLGSAPIAARDYVAIHKRLCTRLTIPTLKAYPSSYVGKVFEIRGTLTGVLEQEGGTSASIIICTEEGSYPITAERAPASTGAQLACLVKIGERSSLSLSDLQLVACTYLAELEALQARSAAKPATTTVNTELTPPRSAAPASKTTGSKITGEQLVAAYKKAIKRFNSKLSDSQAETMARSIIGFSLRYKVDARLVCAVILAESNFRIDATSRAGAQGLGQLMPSTAAGLGVDNAYDPVQNIYGSVRYVKGMLDRMSGNKKWNELTWYDLSLALAAYNAGPGAVKKYGGVPPYRETQNYVRKVTSIYKQLCGVK